MNQSPLDGVTKYTLHFKKTSTPVSENLADLLVWRSIFFRMNLIGQDPNRYDGAGFGNISQKHQDTFIITGTQTGHISQLSEQHFTTITQWSTDRNEVWAQGMVPPSSEAMTHGMIYSLNDKIRYVIHVHSPELWQNRHTLALAETKKDVPYGTPQMAHAVKKLYTEKKIGLCSILAMAGHIDGIIAYGPDLEEAGNLIISTLSKL